MTPRVKNDYSLDRQIVVMRERLTNTPELFSEVYISDHDLHEMHGFREMFAIAQCTHADTPDDADIVVFTGGSDVNPALYGAEKHSKTCFDEERDEKDILLFNHCLEQGIPMFGVCRGLQFLHVMRGGKLYQDVDNHVGGHPIWDAKGKKRIAPVSSVHHQMVIFEGHLGMETLADAQIASRRDIDDNRSIVGGGYLDVEAAFYRDVCALGVQGHPEYKGYDEYRDWCLGLICKYLVESPDLTLIDGCRRVKTELRDERLAMLHKIMRNVEEETV